MAEADALSQYVNGLKVSPRQREDILEAAKKRGRHLVARAKARNEAAMAFTNKPVVSIAVSAVGGGIAEEVRRNAIGRLTSDCRAQGLALILAAGVVKWTGGKIVGVGAVADAHAALGGAVIAASLHGGKAGEKDEDPVAYAYRVTTYKDKEDVKAKAKAGQASK